MILQIIRVESIMWKLVIGALTLLGMFVGQASAATQTFGSGSAVFSVDRSTNLDNMTSLSFEENGIAISRDTSTQLICQTGTICNTHAGFLGLSGNFVYTGSAGNFISVATADNAKMVGIEFNIGTGHNPLDAHRGFWQTLNNGIVADSGLFDMGTLPQVLGLFDLNGFDEVRFAVALSDFVPLDISSFSQITEIAEASALDNISLQLASDDSPTLVPVPAALPLLATALVGFGLLRLRRPNTA
ncbi:MAG: hypothetical protein RIM72_00365 [Alphaproteobacteria bacterium]